MKIRDLFKRTKPQEPNVIKIPHDSPIFDAMYDKDLEYLMETSVYYKPESRRILPEARRWNKFKPNRKKTGYR